ncbi:MAG: DUF4926 domain-containing protein [Gomphosphaeria aponina SAG 52.96 = DSM 107014]|uniref:DUF4926 domain-containing protein n=1 Tax=Gomphosphaeria aponina SAG 52.96 = DSM 107014 TaxID=1521640 RepID=A0A941GUL7_9CHRO|nr:DUF4926 domain-containing protein [Gomphosphaeria aponina SAG 52.96 = DSM 107014]
MIKLYQRIYLNRDLPQHNLKKGEIATVVDIVPHPAQGEDGYVLEVFNAIKKSIKVIIVPQSAIKPLKKDQILTIRNLANIKKY